MYNAVEQARTRELQQQQTQMQLQKAMREQAFREKILGMIQSGMPGTGQSPSADGQTPAMPTSGMPANGRLNPTALGLSLSGIPGAASAGTLLQNATDPGKVIWRDDGAQMVPVYENTGAPAPNVQPIPKQMSPTDRANLDQRRFQFDNMSAADQARFGVQNARLAYETGVTASAPSAPVSPAVGQAGQEPKVYYAPNDAVAAQMAQSLQARGDANFQVTTNPDRARRAEVLAVTGLPPKLANENRAKTIDAANDDFIKNAYRPTVSDAQAARQGNNLIEAYRSIPLSQRTGWGTQAIATAANILTGLGIAPDQAKAIASDAQMFNNLMMQQNWQMLVEQKGVQTEGDAQRARLVFAQLGNTPDANEFIWDMTKALNDNKIEKGRFFSQQYGPARQSGDLAQIESAWAEQNKGFSLFDQPSMKKWKGRATNVKPQGDGAVPAGVTPKQWQFMTPQERALWQN
jgi:hypothetical protein